MNGYHMQEGLIQLGAGWTDRTLNVFSRELAPNQLASVIVSRDDIDGTLATFIDRTMKTLTKQLPRFAMIGREARQYGPVRGESVSFQWRRDGMDVFQSQAFLLVSPKRVMTFTITAPLRFRADAMAELESLLADFKLRVQVRAS